MIEGHRMNVAQLIKRLQDLPPEAVVLMESDGGLSRVSEIELIEAQGPGAPAEVVLGPSLEE
jgi:hypothetical protein